MSFTDFRLPGLRQPERGDIAVFIYPEDTSRDFVKRIIGLPGENIEIKNGNIYVDDELIQEPFIRQNYYYNRGGYGIENNEIDIPESNYYVLGDNSASSRDSRYWGFVDKKLLLGKAVVIYWPINRIRIIH